MRVLITGGCGFIGAHLAKRCLAAGDEVVILDDFSTSSQERIREMLPGQMYVCFGGSILNAERVDELVGRVDAVYHLAAAVGVQLVMEQPERVIQVNVQGSKNVLDACARHGKRLLITSSSEVYGDHRTGEPLRETDRCVYGQGLRWLYAYTKALEELHALHMPHLDVVVARLFNVVGPGQSSRYGMVIPRFLAAAKAGEPLQVHGDGSQTRSFLHVEECAQALHRLLGSGLRDVFNVGAPWPAPIRTVARYALDATGSQSTIEHVPYEQVYGMGIEDVAHREPCIDKITAAVGWTPERKIWDIITELAGVPLAA